MEDIERCLNIANAAFAAGDLDKALRFCKKAKSMKPTKEVELLMRQIEKRREREAGPSSTERTYSPANLTAVEAVLRKKNLYEVLGVTKGASEGEIKKAYKKKALSVHPDRNSAPRSEEAFKLLNEAYAVLSEPEKRAYYDQNGVAPGGKTNNGNVHREGTYAGQGVDVDDIFRMFFSGAGGFGPGASHFAYRGSPFGSGFSRRSTSGTSPNATGSGKGAYFWLVLFVVFWQFINSFVNNATSKASYDIYPSSVHNIRHETFHRRVNFYANRNFNSEYPPKSTTRARVEAEVEYLHFRNDCEYVLIPLNRELRYQTTNKGRAEILHKIEMFRKDAESCSIVRDIEKAFPQVVKDLESNSAILSGYKDKW